MNQIKVFVVTPYFSQIFHTGAGTQGTGTGAPLTHPASFPVAAAAGWLAHSYSDSHATPALSVLVSLPSLLALAG